MKIADIFDDNTFAGAIANGLYSEGKAMAKDKITSELTDALGNQVTRLLAKNRSGIQKALKIFGLDKGGDSDIYGELSGIDDPVLDFEFSVSMPSISSDWVSPVSLNPLWIEDIDIPLESFEVDQMKVNGHPVNVVMFSALSECTINIYADYKNQAQQYINGWYSLIRRKNGRYNLPYAKNNAGYKKLIQVIIYKGPAPIAVISMSGCMPTSITGHSYKSAGGGRQVFAQSISVDKVYFELLPYEDPTKVSLKSNGTILGDVASNTLGKLSEGISSAIRGF